MEFKHIVLIIILLISLYYLHDNIEGFGSGALVQLMAKGPQDRYLTADAEKYLWYQPNNEFIWNNGTRMRGLYNYLNYYPHYYPRYYLHHLPYYNTYGYPRYNTPYRSYNHLANRYLPQYYL